MIRHFSISQLLIALLLFIAPVGTQSSAEEFSTTNLQLLSGSNFHDPFYGNNTSGGAMSTLTLEHFGTWAYGDNYFFVDFLSGSFVNFAGQPAGKQSRIYGEWAPRLSLSKLFAQDLSSEMFKDFYLAAQINRDGDGFHAHMLGVGTDLDLSLFSLFSLNAYARKDNFNSTTWQTTLVWTIPIGKLLSFEGFADLYGSDNNGLEFTSQPQLLFDLGALAIDSPNSMKIGLEWYFHRNRHLNSSVPQAILKWIW